jgi:hypothetical protein
MFVHLLVEIFLGEFGTVDDAKKIYEDELRASKQQILTSTTCIMFG